MAGTVSSTTSSLASELLLNKIMNGQVQTSTGKSVTAAGRAVANRLSSTAYELRTAEKNMAYGEGFVTAAQGEVSGLKDQLTSMKKNLMDVYNNQAANGTDFKNAGVAAKEAFAQYSAALNGAKYNGQALFASATKMALNAGNGLTISVLGDNLKTHASAFTQLKTAVTAVTDKAKASAALTAIDNAISVLEGYEAKYGEDIKALQNRQLLLADQGASLDSTAAAQSVASLSGASNLLSAMLGYTQA